MGPGTVSRPGELEVTAHPGDSSTSINTNASEIAIAIKYIESVSEQHHIDHTIVLDKIETEIEKFQAKLDSVDARLSHDVVGLQVWRDDAKLQEDYKRLEIRIDSLSDTIVNLEDSINDLQIQINGLEGGHNHPNWMKGWLFK